MRTPTASVMSPISARKVRPHPIAERAELGRATADIGNGEAADKDLVRASSLFEQEERIVRPGERFLARHGSSAGDKRGD